MVKKKAPVFDSDNAALEEGNHMPENTEDNKDERRPVFRNATFQHSTTAGKKKTWRSLKQILAHEKSLPWPKDTPLYSNITAPPSFKPPKKYSDISGLEAKYTDPQTKLFYSNTDEFATVRTLPSDIIAGYLTLRGANNPIG
ncbi:unnamed protein product [Nezara viridula]|uniref:Vps72/YL1 C-terminal domain-containing protein n=1 Tax=Nezara viridula TaxID=85310 RepID=A0A9P0H578_NEZVI|nr:unnamed protein product [Nezara viridula]